MLADFLRLLTLLAHAQGEAVMLPVPRLPGQGTVLYGGNALEAFWIAIQTGAHFFLGFPYGQLVHLGPGTPQPL
jgi:hypothetical protein